MKASDRFVTIERIVSNTGKLGHTSTYNFATAGEVDVMVTEGTLDEGPPGTSPQSERSFCEPDAPAVLSLNFVGPVKKCLFHTSV